MASNDQDLKFKLTVEPDTGKAQAAIRDLGKEIDAQVRIIQSDLSLLPQEKLLTSIDGALGKNNKQWAYQGRLVSELEADLRRINSELLLPQEQILNGIGASLDANNARWAQQAKLVGMIQGDLSAMSAGNLLPSEKLLTSIDTSLGKEGPQEKSGFGGFISRLLNGGINTRQLAGSAIGGAIGGGPGGALGAAAGGAGIEALSGALGPIGIAAGVAAGGLLLVKDVITGLSDTIERFAAVASPAGAFRWQYTLRDLQGVVGQRLVPILDLMTDGVRAFADLLANVLPQASTIQGVTNDIRAFFGSIRDGRNQIRDFLVDNSFTKWINSTFPKELLHIGKTGDQSSFGAAARPARFEGIEEYEKGFQQAALSASSMQSIPQKQLNVLEEIRDSLKAKSLFSGQSKEKTGDEIINNGINRAIFGH